MEDKREIYRVLIRSTMQEYKTIQGLCNAYDSVRFGLYSSNTKVDINRSRSMRRVKSAIEEAVRKNGVADSFLNFETGEWKGNSQYPYVTLSNYPSIAEAVESYQKAIKVCNKIHDNLLKNAEEIIVDRLRGQRNVVRMRIDTLMGFTNKEGFKYIDERGNLSFSLPTSVRNDSEVIRLTKNFLETIKLYDRWCNAPDESDDYYADSKVKLSSEVVGIKQGELKKLIKGVGEKIGKYDTRRMVYDAWKEVMRTDENDCDIVLGEVLDKL